MTRAPIAGFLMAALSAAALTSAHAQTELRDGESSAPFTLEPGETRAFYIDVPPGATHLELLLESERVNREDVDLFVRYAEAFDAGANPFPQSLYYSVGETGFEHVEVTFASSPPVSPGRWHVLVVNAHPERNARNAVVTAALQSQSEPSLRPLELEIAYTDPAGSGFKDNTPFTPEGGNGAATLGDARKAAFEQAMQLLSESFTSPVAVTVEARFEDMGGREDGGAPLASAGPTFVFRDFPGARASNTWYAGSIVPRLSGTDSCRLSSNDCRQNPEPDMRIRFNSNQDIDWWYGFERSPGSTMGGMDFIAVAMHEMMHGLGFLTFADVQTGALATFGDGTPRTDAYLSQLVWRENGQFRQVDQLNKNRRLQAFTSLFNLFWGGEYGEQFWDMRFSSDPLPPLYSPTDPNPGSSISHVNFPDIMFWRGDGPTDNEDIEIRESGPGLGAAWYLLRDAGWDEDGKPLLDGAVVPRLGMWFDRARDGHGFDLQRAGNTWFLTFFTYGDNGEPEWLLGIGEVVNGVFSGTLDRFTFDSADSPPQTGVEAGNAVIDFSATSGSPACDDGTDRSDAVQLATFSWTIDGEAGEWCVQPLIASGEPTTPPDFSGHWWAGESDQGWGLTVYQQGPVLFAVLYYYDADGNPRWALGSTTDWSNGDEIVMDQFDGFCRDCAPEALESIEAGILTLDLGEPTQGDGGNNAATVDVTYQGPDGGTWERTGVPIKLLSDPA